MAEKSKFGSSLSASINASASESAFILRTHEANLHRAYQARRWLLKGEEDVDTMDDGLNDELGIEELILNEYAFMENFFEWVFLLSFWIL